MDEQKNVETQEIKTKQAVENYDHMTPAQWLMRAIQGALIGVGSILPGVSGGVMCVLFGIYKPMMALLAHPFKTFKQYYKLFIPVGIGFVIGFVLLAKLVGWAFGENMNIATCLFFGLIVGTIPSLWREAGQQGRGKSGWIAFGVSFVALLAFLGMLKFSAAMTITPNPWWFLFCGVVWGLSLVVPGLSSSSILLFMGLYEPMSNGIGDLKVMVLLPLVIGILISALSCARGVEVLLNKHYQVFYHVIMGVVCASTLLILPTQFAGVGEGLICLACAIVGCVLALLLDKWGDKIKQKNEIAEP